MDFIGQHAIPDNIVFHNIANELKKQFDTDIEDD